MSSVHSLGPGAMPSGLSVGIASSPESLVWAQSFLFVSWTSIASAVWISANRAVAFPFILPEPRTLLQMYVHNGSVVSGNLDVGVYYPGGARIVSSGSVAQAGTSTIQLVDVVDTVLPANRLMYAALAVDNGTATVFRWAAGANTGQVRAGGLMQMAAAFPLPDPITLVDVTSNHMPDFGLVFASTV